MSTVRIAHSRGGSPMLGDEQIPFKAGTGRFLAMLAGTLGLAVIAYWILLAF